MAAELDTRLIGALGEADAASYLKKRHWRIEGMNHRTRFGEVDIIATKNNVIAFIEVKTRRTDAYGQAREFVDSRKQHRVILAAMDWLKRYPTTMQPRFDVMEMYFDPVKKRISEVNHIENAFEAEHPAF